VCEPRSLFVTLTCLRERRYEQNGNPIWFSLAFSVLIRARERLMPTLVNKIHPALKHGGYAATAILPGENRADFEKLHQSLVAELAPLGALEDDIVATIARMVWRKRNLATVRLADLAGERCEAIRSEHVAAALVEKRGPIFNDLSEIELETAEREAAVQTAERQARKELGEVYELAEIGKTATVDGLLRALGVEERLDAMIDKCLKQLLFLRGLKSLSVASSSAPSQSIPKPQRIPGPTRAA
jgi:hypothetical protein